MTYIGTTPTMHRHASTALTEARKWDSALSRPWTTPEAVEAAYNALESLSEIIRAARPELMRVRAACSREEAA